MYKTMLLFLISVPWNVSFSQQDTTAYKYWINAGLFFSDSDVSADLSYNFGFNKRFYNVSYIKKGGWGTESTGSNGYSYNTINVGMGIRHFERFFLASAFIGPSFLWGKKDYKEKMKSYYTGGAVLDAQFIIIPIEALGFGLEFFSNINFEKPFFALQFSIHVSNNL